jgi:hypothetical protein
LTIPAELTTGDYVECLGDGPVRVFDRNGVTLATVTPRGAAPILQPGANEIKIGGATSASAVLTVITIGAKIFAP